MIYDTFLSHNSDDKLIVEVLAHKLKQAGFEPWLDKWNLIPGNPWQEEIEKALADCTTCCICIGHSGMGPWQNAEMRAAIDRRVSGNEEFRVIPVLLPNSQRPERSKLPTFLTQTTWVEFLKGFDEAETFHRLTCAIKGIAPGSGLDRDNFKYFCPYRGLEVFDAEHAPFFFGREALTEWLLKELRPQTDPLANRFLAIIGASGSGKSSLVRAGLIAKLKENALGRNTELPVIILKPGNDPLETLAVRFASDPANVKALYNQFQTDASQLHLATRFILREAAETDRLILFIDQFEEVFTLCQKISLRQAFIDNLLYAANEPLGQTIGPDSPNFS